MKCTSSITLSSKKYKICHVWIMCILPSISFVYFLSVSFPIALKGNSSMNSCNMKAKLSVLILGQKHLILYPFWKLHNHYCHNQCVLIFTLRMVLGQKRLLKEIMLSWSSNWTETWIKLEKNKKRFFLVFW